MTVTLHIDRLVLDGLAVSSQGGRVLSTAVEAELTRLLASGALPVSSGISVPRLAAPGVTLEAGATPAALGTQVAGALFSGLSQSIDGPVRPAGAARR